MQILQPIRRRTRVDRITIAPRQELGAGRGRSDEPNPVAFAVVRLMNVAPHDSPYVRMRVDDAPELGGIGEADAVQPTAAHRHRMMMQTHQRMGGPTLEGLIESCECA